MIKKLLVFTYIMIYVSSLNADTLDMIKDRGYLRCGVNGASLGLSKLDKNGKYSGFDIEGCKALAVAVFGDKKKVKFVPLIQDKDRFSKLLSYKVDVMFRSATMTFSRENDKKVYWAGINFYDGQTFIVKKSLRIKNIKDLDGLKVCHQKGSTAKINAKDFALRNGIKFDFLAQSNKENPVYNLIQGKCDSYIDDLSFLYSIQKEYTLGDDYRILTQLISKEPLGPVVRDKSDRWFDIVEWTLYALISAEELGVSSKNVDEKLNSNNPKIRRLLGVKGNLGQKLGLRNDWVYQIIKEVGKYGEIFDKTLRKELGMKRGLNALWTRGGLLYAPPFR